MCALVPLHQVSFLGSRLCKRALDQRQYILLDKTASIFLCIRLFNTEILVPQSRFPRELWIMEALVKLPPQCLSVCLGPFKLFLKQFNHPRPVADLS